MNCKNSSCKGLEIGQVWTKSEDNLILMPFSSNGDEVQTNISGTKWVII